MTTRNTSSPPDTKQPTVPQDRDRPRGRPSAAESADVRDALLDAAAQLFSEHGYEGTSVRQLATSAGVTPAMVHYYFGNKNGLYQALLERAFDGLLPHIMGLAEAATSEEVMTTIFDVAHGALIPQPWIAQLMLREVLSQEGKLRDVFVDRFASRVATRVSGVLRHQQEEGTLRSDLDPKLIYVCLIALVIFPILGRPVLEQILGRSLADPELLAELRQTAQSIFFAGVLGSDVLGRDELDSEVVGTVGGTKEES